MSQDAKTQQVLSMLRTDSTLTDAERQTMFDLVERCTGLKIPAAVNDGGSQPGQSFWKWLVRFNDHIAPMVGLGNTLIQTEPAAKVAWKDQWPRAAAAEQAAKQKAREQRQAEKQAEAERAKQDADSQEVKA